MILVKNSIKPQRFGYAALAIWFLACLWQGMSFVMAGLIGTTVGGDIGAIIFSAMSIIGLVMYISGLIFGGIALKRDIKKVVAWISLVLHSALLFFTVVLIIVGFVVRF